MKKVLAALALVLSCAAGAQEIEIKGIRIGMTRDEFKQAFPNGVNDFTVAGVPSKYRGGPSLDWIDDKLEGFIFFFHPRGFQDVKAAVEGKYPKLQCEKSTIKNRMGAEYGQEECKYGLLRLARFQGDIETGSLAVFSEKAQEAMRKKRSEKAKDI